MFKHGQFKQKGRRGEKKKKVNLKPDMSSQTPPYSVFTMNSTQCVLALCVVMSTKGTSYIILAVLQQQKWEQKWTNLQKGKKKKKKQTL